MNVQRLRLASLLSAGAIFALMGLRQFFFDPMANPTGNIVSFWIVALPIVLIVPGMLRLNPRGYLFAALAGMLYFCHGVWLAVSPVLRSFGIWEVAFALALVASATLTLRLLKGTREDQ
jgi:uncharacterized membrane protein